MTTGAPKTRARVLTTWLLMAGDVGDEGVVVVVGKASRVGEEEGDVLLLLLLLLWGRKSVPKAERRGIGGKRRGRVVFSGASCRLFGVGDRPVVVGEVV